MDKKQSRLFLMCPLESRQGISAARLAPRPGVAAGQHAKQTVTLVFFIDDA
jgi:hypothetical protein